MCIRDSLNISKIGISHRLIEHIIETPYTRFTDCLLYTSMASDPDADRVGMACKNDKGEWVLKMCIRDSCQSDGVWQCSIG